MSLASLYECEQAPKAGRLVPSVASLPSHVARRLFTNSSQYLLTITYLLLYQIHKFVRDIEPIRWAPGIVP